MRLNIANVVVLIAALISAVPAIFVAFLTIVVSVTMFDYPRHDVKYFVAYVAWWVGFVSSCAFSLRFKGLGLLLKNEQLLVLSLLIGVGGVTFLEIAEWGDATKMFPAGFFVAPLLSFIIAGIVRRNSANKPLEPTR